MEQVEIQKILHPFFEHGISASSTARETKIDVKTICVYFDEWAEQESKLHEREFLDRQKNYRERIIVSFDRDILDARKFYEEADSQIKKYKDDGKPIPMPLLRIKLEIMKYISGLKENKGAFMMQPSMDEALKKKIEEYIKENAKTG